ncbi:sterile alpha motif domain-containing protein 13 [Sorex araneus]|uniref:sterile alpha motif domain-containing protein 13 n=1 Tax=Sorex araneus TaxID=42254 RepID=UPI0024340915|nr:sterile alpha motif domain-containing protein 13 [Sorex araneus]
MTMVLEIRTWVFGRRVFHTRSQIPGRVTGCRKHPRQGSQGPRPRGCPCWPLRPSPAAQDYKSRHASRPPHRQIGAGGAECSARAAGALGTCLSSLRSRMKGSEEERTPIAPPHHHHTPTPENPQTKLKGERILPARLSQELFLPPAAGAGGNSGFLPARARAPPAGRAPSRRPGASWSWPCPREASPNFSITASPVAEVKELCSVPMLSVDMENKENGSVGVKNSMENGRPPDPADWAVIDVVNYFRTVGFEEQATAFEEQEIDGKSLLLMTRNDVLTGLQLKLGPALKIYEYHVKPLQTKHLKNNSS